LKFRGWRLLRPFFVARHTEAELRSSDDISMVIGTGRLGLAAVNFSFEVKIGYDEDALPIEWLKPSNLI
jgi:hypothetical protein